MADCVFCNTSSVTGMNSLIIMIFFPGVAGGASHPEWSTTQPSSDAHPKGNGAEEAASSWIWSIRHGLQGQHDMLIAVVIHQCSCIDFDNE